MYSTFFVYEFGPIVTSQLRVDHKEFQEKMLSNPSMATYRSHPPKISPPGGANYFSTEIFVQVMACPPYLCHLEISFSVEHLTSALQSPFFTKSVFKVIFQLIGHTSIKYGKQESRLVVKISGGWCSTLE